jgi:hypothetical protein
MEFFVSRSFFRIVAPKIFWKYLVLLVVATCAGLLALFYVWPASAAVELNYFTVTSASSVVLLDWGTAREYDLQGFQVLCKQASEPDIAYHPIGVRAAKGNATTGAQYDFLVDRGLTPGVSYCFRLREITTTGDPGEVFERCGYGLNITPTPTLDAQAFMATTIAADATATMNAILTPTNIITDPAILALTAQAPISPLEPPTATFTPDIIATAAAQAATAQAQATFDAIATTQAQVTAAVDQLALTAQASTPSPAATVQSIDASSIVDANGGLSTPVPGGTQAIAPESGVSAASADGDSAPPAVSYIVQTATPTLPPVTLAPTFTPLPTVPPTPVSLLAALATSNTQTMMILLLFLVFIGASGVGLVGVLSGIFYVRTRSTPRRNHYDSLR